MLPPDDESYLKSTGLDYVVHTDGGMTCVVIRNFPLPPGFSTDRADLLLRLPSGYPNAAPDMWWFDPAVTRVDGLQIAATEIRETHLGRQWQRWSRHLQAGQWRSGIDLLQQFIAIIRTELDREVGRMAA